LRLLEARSQTPLFTSSTTQLGGVRSLAFSRDDRLVAAGGADGSVLVWDLSGASSSRRVIGTARPPSGFVDAIFSPRGRFLATAPYVWDASSSHGRPVLTAPGVALAFGAEGTVTTMSERGVVRRTTLRGRELSRSTVHGSVAGAAFAPNGDAFVIVRPDGTVERWEGTRRVSRDERLVSPFRRSSFLKMSASSDLRVVALSGLGLFAVLQLRPDGHYERLVQSQENVYSMALSRDGASIATATANEIDLRSIASPKTAQLLGKQGTTTRSLAFTPDGKILGSGDEQGVIQLWDVRSRRTVGGEFSVEAGNWVLAMGFNRDGRTLAAATGTTVSTWPGILAPSTWRRRLCGVVRRNLSHAERADYGVSGEGGRTCTVAPAPE
jgi:WD40 repeat protein